MKDKVEDEISINSERNEIEEKSVSGKIIKNINDLAVSAIVSSTFTSKYCNEISIYYDKIKFNINWNR